MFKLKFSRKSIAHLMRGLVTSLSNRLVICVEKDSLLTGPSSPAGPMSDINVGGSEVDLLLQHTDVYRSLLRNIISVGE